MTTPLAIKRMTRERAALEQANLDYVVHFKDDDLLKFEAYVLAPEDSLYQHKLVKLRFEIPQEYPLVPPKITFVQHSGGRIHPNLYVEGKVCLSILGTWQGEPWAYGMSCDTVLITIRSLLDNSPYQHEPGCRDHPGFNAYVGYSTWRTLLLDYLRHEASPPLRAFLRRHVRERAPRMLQELRRQQAANAAVRMFASPYDGEGRRSQAGAVAPEYALLVMELEAAVVTAAAETGTGKVSSSGSSKSSGSTASPASGAAGAGKGVKRSLEVVSPDDDGDDDDDASGSGASKHQQQQQQQQKKKKRQQKRARKDVIDLT